MLVVLELHLVERTAGSFGFSEFAQADAAAGQPAVELVVAGGRRLGMALGDEGGEVGAGVGELGFAGRAVVRRRRPRCAQGQEVGRGRR